MDERTVTIAVEQTGYPSVDQPWLKYYDKSLLNSERPSCSVYRYMFENNKDNLNGMALNFFGKKMSYRKMLTEIDNTAKSLINLGVKPGDVVAVVTISCVQAVLCFYALNKIGAISNYLNVLSSEHEIKKYVEEGKTRIILTLDLFGNKVCNATKNTSVETIVFFSLNTYMPKVTALLYTLNTKVSDDSFLDDERFISWDYFLNSVRGIDFEKEAIEHECPDDICFYGHTSGTTGFPKTVLLTNAAFNFVVWQYVHQLERDKGDVFLNVIPPFVTYGAAINMHMPLCAGMETVLVPKFDAKKWAHYLKKYKPSHISAIPTFVSTLSKDRRLKTMDLSFLKTIGVGGEGMNIPLERKLNAFLVNHGSRAKLLKGYGMTEVCGTATAENNDVIKEGSVGISLIGNNLMIYDNDNGQELPYLEIGEVCMRCVSTMAGYKDNQLETNKLIKEHADGTKWIHTGDIGYIDEDGFLFIEGRMKRMIMTIIDGVVYKIAPSQTEKVLNSHKKVKDSCVVKFLNEDDVVLKAFIILEDKIGPDKVKSDKFEKELRRYCRKTLGKNQRPAVYEVIDEFPKTAAGKVDYRKLEMQQHE